VADVLHEVLLLKIRDDRVEETLDSVAAEGRITLTVNGEPLVSLLCTPRDLEAMAVGFLFSESLLSGFDALRSVTVVDDRVDVAADDLPADWRERVRVGTLASGCGRGVTFSVNLQRPVSPRKKPHFVLRTGWLANMLKHFSRMSELFEKTGGVHSAALADLSGEIRFFAEDIGRHNAVDKIIGNAVIQAEPLDDKILLSSGRISVEIISKIVRAGIPVLVSRSAPTCMAVTMAEDHGVTLVGFARGSRMNIYSHPWRFRFEGDAR